MARRLVEDVVEVRLPKPALRDHHLVPAIDLDTDVREVEQVCGRTDRRTYSGVFRAYIRAYMGCLEVF